MSVDNIPVTIYGIPVGVARVYDDGAIDISMNSNPNTLGRDLLQGLVVGMYSGFAIEPVVIAAVNADGSRPNPAGEFFIGKNKGNHF